ncbi:zinc ribbon domain-containing protein [Streptomyces mirabilis]|uniref:zinc ribbon domain-containing protein n=1 Tax=Streptomyces mirabilis TaxID=68239 RepID=UPI0036630C8E
MIQRNGIGPELRRVPRRPQRELLSYGSSRSNDQGVHAQDISGGNAPRRLPRGQWQVLLPEHHQGFIDWTTFEANQTRIGQNTRPDRHGAGTGAFREGCALLQGLAVCGHCGRKLAVHYRGKHRATPGYQCHGADAA